MAHRKTAPGFGPLLASFFVALLVPAAAAGAVVSGETALMGEVRIFEVRRPNSDFTPLDGLRFRLETDGRGVRVSQWLATLARRIPEAYLAQLGTFGPFPLEPAGASGSVRRRGGRGIQARLTRDPQSGAPEDVSVSLTLLRGDEPAHEFRASDLGVRAGETVFVSGREFEIPGSVYLSWFREPPDREARGRLYERLRNQTIFLVLGVTIREGAGHAAAPLPLRPPDDPRLHDLGPSLVGPSTGRVTLRASVAEDGTLHDIQVVETTFPEVMPRVLGIIRDWTLPEASGQTVLLSFPVTAPPRQPASPDRR